MQQPDYIKLPAAPVTGSPVPSLTSLYHGGIERGPYGSKDYPGNCGGYIIRDLLRYYEPKRVLDPMTGSGTCRDVCRELGITCLSFDLRFQFDACSPSGYVGIGEFDFVWLHPPYWRQKIYSHDMRDMSQQPTLAAFLDKYDALIKNCMGALTPGGKLAILMGDYSDREAGFVPLVFYTKLLAFRAGMRQCETDIIRFSHGASSSKKVYTSKFIPGLHDVCMIFERKAENAG